MTLPSPALAARNDIAVRPNQPDAGIVRRLAKFCLEQRRKVLQDSPRAFVVRGHQREARLIAGAEGL
jgi:hypothetical protein